MYKLKCATNLSWDYNGWRKLSMSANPYTQKDWNQTLMTMINKMRNIIRTISRKEEINNIRCNTKVLDLLKTLEYYDVIAKSHNILTDDLIEENVLYLYSNDLLKPKDKLIIPDVIGDVTGFEEIILRYANHLSDNEIDKYRNKLIGKINILNYEEETPINEVDVIKAPNALILNGVSVFLAGSIEMGKAVDWQTEIENKLKALPYLHSRVTLLNPRRDNWNSSWKQDINNKKFKEQVLWELNALEIADKIVVYIDPKTTSPITLLEIGLHANSKKICVCCPEGFYRKGNIDIVCERYEIPMVDNIDGLVDFILDE